MNQQRVSWEQGREEERNNIYWKTDLLKQVYFETFELKHVWEKIWMSHLKKMQHFLLVLHFLFGSSLLYSTDFKTCLRFCRFSITSLMVHNEIPGSSKKKKKDLMIVLHKIWIWGPLCRFTDRNVECGLKQHSCLAHLCTLKCCMTEHKLCYYLNLFSKVNLILTFTGFFKRFVICYGSVMPWTIVKSTFPVFVSHPSPWWIIFQWF